MEKMTVSIVTPTLNIMRVIDDYLQAIMMQTYPHDVIEIIIADGGSTDGSIEKLKEYNDKSDINITVYDNPLRTAEAGKAVGVRKAKSDVVLLLDSDNILPDEKWLERMMIPFEDKSIVASEPISFTYRKEDGLVNRYCSLLGMGDPLCLFMGNYDRYSYVSNTWTKIPHEEKDMGDYLSIRFYNAIPTIGANGFIMRTKELNDNFEGDYLFDIDVLWKLFQNNYGLLNLISLNLSYNFITNNYFFLCGGKDILLENLRTIDLSMNQIDCNDLGILEQIEKFINNYKKLKKIKIQENCFMNDLYLLYQQKKEKIEEIIDRLSKKEFKFDVDNIHFAIINEKLRRIINLRDKSTV